ncbi:MAG: SMC family ATPase [Methanobacterium sp.]|uniref:AAA family ATPase n=1 Tax=Methanobacterium sp. TaxID=2164 RepID=UPI003D657BB1|nr:SMC family ATPase [Methanobacterium sp.]
MIFKTLSMTNIRSYKNHKPIEFPMGTSLFEGDIGSGKSTILMAIEFALFGLGNQKGDSILRKGSKNGSVLLEFMVGNNNYQIRRTLIRNEKDGSVRQDKGLLGINGKKIHLSASEIKEKVLDILNFKEPLNPRAQSVIFRYAVYTPQEEMKYILSQKPDDRLQTLRKAFGIEDYKIAAENANLISRSIKDKVIELKAKTADLDEKKQDLFILKGKLEENENKLAKFKVSKEELEKLLKEQNEALEKLQESELELKKIQAEIPHLKKQIKDKEELSIKYQDEIKNAEEENRLKFILQIEKIEKIKKPTNETEEDLSGKLAAIKKIVKDRDSLTSNLVMLNDNRQSFENELGNEKKKVSKDLQNEQESLKLKIEEQSNLVDSHKEQLQIVSKKIYKLEAKKSDITEKLENLDGLGDLCPICGSTLNEEHKKNLKTESDTSIRKIDSENRMLSHVEEKGKEELKQYEKELKNLENNLNDLKFLTEKVSNLEKVKNKIISIKEKISSLDINLESITEYHTDFDEIEDYINHFEVLMDKLKEYNRSQKELENIKYQLKKNLAKIKLNKESINVLTNEINDLKQDLSKFEEKSAELANVPPKIVESKLEYEKTVSQMQLIKENMASAKTLMEKLLEDISKVRDEIARKESLTKQLSKCNDYHIWVNDYLIPTLSLIEKHVMQKRFEEFNDNFQKWFNILIEDTSKNAKIDEEFTPIVEQDGFEQDINYLSGGEKTSVALAYRLALNNVVQHVSTGMKSNLLILDEPTDGFSREQLYKVREILNELKCPQVILVSHERELGSFADNVFKVEKIDGYSTVSKQN